MAEPVEENCPIRPSFSRASERFTTVKVAKHSKKKSGRNGSHRMWIEEHTTNGTLTEIREDLPEQG